MVSDRTLDGRFGSVPAFATVRDFSALAACYAELNGRFRPEADIQKYLRPQLIIDFSA
jgi:hypothetical protein